MEAVGQLTGGLAHDFNNLLAGISGSLDLMQNRIAQRRFDELERYIAGAQGAAKRAAALTHRLLAFSRRQTLEPKPTDVDRLVAGMEDMIRRTVGPAATVEFHGTNGLWSTLVDPNQLENALLNLCINARDALPDGGLISIETANRTIDNHAGGLRDIPAGDYVSLAVSDNGAGMTPDVVQRAFEPFFTTKPTGQGTGLGLSMAYGFVKQSGGEIVLYSEIGKGTRVQIWLPRSEAEPAEPDDLAAMPLQGGPETILVVEDEEQVRNATCGILSALGYRVLEAADAASAKRIVESGEQIDLVFSDVIMPGPVSSLQLGETVRARLPEAQILYTSGYAEGVLAHEGKLDARINLLQKPYHPDALSARIRHLLRRRAA
jgi:CheY-like chemotaxis protein